MPGFYLPLLVSQATIPCQFSVSEATVELRFAFVKEQKVRFTAKLLVSVNTDDYFGHTRVQFEVARLHHQQIRRQMLQIIGTNQGATLAMFVGVVRVHLEQLHVVGHAAVVQITQYASVVEQGKHLAKLLARIPAIAELTL